MAEYMVKVEMSAAGTRSIGIKGKILGVYSSAAVKLAWDYNGEVGDITPTAATVWEPHNPFIPAATSKLVITSTSAATVVIRME